MDTQSLLRVAFLLYASVLVCAGQKYYGTHISRLSEHHHAVSGDVFAVDSRTLFIKGFNYDGEGPAAYFYVGNTKAPNNQGAFRIRDEKGSAGVLSKYRNKDITLTLPEGKTLRDIKWFSVWCDDFSVDFGSVTIPKNLEFPRPQKIGGLKGIHAVQSDSIVIVDAQTLLIPNFSYDGVAPDAKFWVGRGAKPSPAGVRISDENGKESPLKRYDRKTIVLTLPGELTVFDVGHFGVWCEAFTVDFGHVKIPERVNVPPSLKMLGISPQSKLNCEVLHDELAFEVRWAVAGESVVIQLVSKLDDNEYMSFGVSSDADKSLMIGGDVVVAWVNRLTGKGYAQDYFLEAKSQCSGNHGSCPDTRLKDNSNSIRLLNAAIVNDYSIVTYQRPLKPADSFDRQIYVNRSQAIIWAIGPLNQRFEVSYHSQFLKKDKFIDFGRQPFWNCPIPENEGKPLLTDVDNGNYRPQTQPLNQPNINRADSVKPPVKTTQRPVPTPKPVAKRDAWEIPPIQCNEPDDGVFYAQMGPTGGKHGYPAITGHVGWGISWYINGLLIPEINVVRNKTYTFVVEGGNDENVPAKYHPFYITNDPVGGFEHKIPEDKDKIKIYAGVQRSRDGKVKPTGIGRICNWTPDQSGPGADEFPSFGAYQRSLSLKCDEGEPGIITWTPDSNTPDTVYYQCFTHRYLGWKINVLDSCDLQGQGSERDEVYADAEAEASINHESKLLPSENFLQHHEKDLIKHHNMNGGASKVTADLQKSGEFNKLIVDGIKAAEALEETLRTNVTQEVAPENDNQENDKELLDAIAKIPQANRPNHPNHPNQRPQQGPPRRPQFPSPGLPVYLRPPQSGGYPYHSNMRLPPRRPIALERRPVSRKPVNPYLLPQQSIMVNSYKRPPPQQQQIHPGNVRNAIKPNFPPKHVTPVLLLGQPTEIKSPYKKSSNDVIRKPPPKAPGNILPPFKLKPSDSPRPYKTNVKKIEKLPPRSPFKDPFDIKNEPISLREAANTGFKPDTVIVESGFRPIFRREDVIHREDESEEESDDRHVDSSKQTISRRSDDFDESEETYSQSTSAFFEPMFIPSPLDSAALPLVKESSQEDQMLAEASERQDFFYLPPSDSKRSAVSYDGKAILDTSLLNDPLPSQNDLRSLSSKTKQFIKDTPQFAPFKGEIPSDLMLQLSASRVEAPISTKLSAVKTIDGSIL